MFLRIVGNTAHKKTSWGLRKLINISN
jgi:hypothetical protein